MLYPYSACIPGGIHSKWVSEKCWGTWSVQREGERGEWVPGNMRWTGISSEGGGGGVVSASVTTNLPLVTNFNAKWDTCKLCGQLWLRRHHCTTFRKLVGSV